jgi:hypothetical protein
MTNVLKKASIIVGAVLAGLVALGSLAFADGGRHDDDSQICKKDSEHSNPINILNVGGGNFNKCNIIVLPHL